MNTINIRIDEKTKKKASKTLASLGLDMSTAVKMFLHQVITEDGLPFQPRRRTPQEIRAKWDLETAEALKKPGFATVDAMIKDIMRN